MPNIDYLIGANDEHGVNPPTPGKRTPVLPGLDRQIYENEFNRAAKSAFIEGCLRNGFSVYDVKPEEQDVPVAARVARINRRDLTLLVTFAYNAFGAGNTFNSASGVTVYYSALNRYRERSRQLSEEIYESLVGGIEQRGRGVRTIDGVGVLDNVDCPSTLIEAGFMTNLFEAQLMIDPSFTTEVGEETVRGVCNYLGVPYVARSIENYPLIKYGNRGNFVTLLQFLLTGYGYGIDVDGIFGTQTRDVVIDFQRANGIKTDGIVGEETWRYLLSLPPYPVLRRGDSGAYVLFLQKKLASYLVPVGRNDGVFGTMTENAVKAFQSQRGITVDGIVGPVTWANLLKERKVGQ